MSIRDIKDFVAVDFETATPDRFICQVGITIVENLQIVDTIVKFIQPPDNRYDINCMAVHHISPEKTKDAPTFDKAWAELAPYFQDRVLVAHNASFDADVLRRNLNYYNIKADGIRDFECTFCLLNGSLEYLCVAYGMEYTDHHDAGFDSKCCAQFFLNYINGIMPDHNRVPLSFFKEKKKKKRSPDYSGHDRIKGSVLKKDLTNADPNNPFYNRKVVITGVFPVSRIEIANKLKTMGADVDTGVTKRTNFVIVGDEAGWKKLEKIDTYNAQGAEIQTIKWDELSEIFSVFS